MSSSLPNPGTPLEVSTTVYSVVWPSTEALMRRCMFEETQQMLERHRQPVSKSQDLLHGAFFDAWRRFADPAVLGLDQFPESYPSGGSSEAIREVIRQAGWEGKAIVVFDGEYEGYEALAVMQGSLLIRVDRATWPQTLAAWRANGTPWGDAGAQWWISQPSAIDGNSWEGFAGWLADIATLPGLEAWVDLCYVGSARMSHPVDLSHAPNVAGVVFSLSKSMGSYYRRIGGCLSRAPLPGLWANRWFKNIDSLYLGQRWLQESGDALSYGQQYGLLQSRAMDRVMDQMGGHDLWRAAGIQWQPAQVPLLMFSHDVLCSPPASGAAVWNSARRGHDTIASARLCLSPAIEALLAINALR
jgi:hypothetical protein